MSPVQTLHTSHSFDGLATLVFSSNTVLTTSLGSISEGTQLVLIHVLYRSMSVEFEGSVIKIDN